MKALLFHNGTVVRKDERLPYESNTELIDRMGRELYPDATAIDHETIHVERNQWYEIDAVVRFTVDGELDRVVSKFQIVREVMP